MDDLAFAIYQFDLTDANPEGLVRLDFEQLGDAADLWIGISNFGGGAWEWYGCEGIADGRISTEVELTDRPHPESHLLYVVTVFAGNDSWELSEIQIGNGSPPGATEISPSSAEYGTTVQFTATVSGTSPLIYAWDFTDIGEPSTSTESSPLVLLTNTGAQEGQLQLSNAYGEYTKPFSILIQSYPASVLSVSPLYSASGTTVTFNAIVTGSEPLDYAWDFGGGASPNTSSDAEPVVTVGSPGKYAAELVLTNDFGSHDYDFTLTAYEDTPEWVHTWGTNRDENADRICVDSTGRLVCAGTHTSPDTISDAIVTAVFDQAGYPVWQRYWDGPEDDRGWAVCVGQDDCIYVLGYTLSFLPEGRNSQIAILKYSATGELLWQRTWADGGSQGAVGLGLHPDGGVIIAGGVTTSYSPKVNYLLVLSLDSDGNQRWARTWDTGRDESALNLLVLGSGAILVAGGTNGSPDEENVFPYGYKSSALLLSFGIDGSLNWERCWGTVEPDGWSDLAVDPSGNIYAAGVKSISGDGHDKDVIVAKYSALGTMLWGKVLNKGIYDTATGLAFADGSLWITTHSYPIGEPPFDVHQRLLKLSPEAVIQNTWLWDTAEDSYFGSIFQDGAGNLFICGYAANNSGNWMTSSFDFVSPGTAEKEIHGTLGTTTGELLVPDGVSAPLPAGVIDTGGGRHDMLLIKKKS